MQQKQVWTGIRLFCPNTHHEGPNNAPMATFVSKENIEPQYMSHIYSHIYMSHYIYNIKYRMATMTQNLCKGPKQMISNSQEVNEHL